MSQDPEPAEEGSGTRKRTREAQEELAADSMTETMRAMMEEMKSLKTGVESMEKEVKSLKTGVESMEARMGSMEGMEGRLMARMDSMTDTLELLTEANPLAHASRVVKPVAVEADAEEALRSGVTATFTFMSLTKKDGTKVHLAVGAAHCAVYGSKTSECKALFLPLSVINCDVQRVVLSPAKLLDDIQNDFVVLVLGTGGPAAVAWPESVVKNAEEAARQRKSVYGRSNSGAVVGTDLHLAEPTGKFNGCFSFLEESGEPGHSGALMYSRISSSDKVLGVYFGNAERNPPMRDRGIIVPLPDAADLEAALTDGTTPQGLEVFDVVQPPTTVGTKFKPAGGTAGGVSYYLEDDRYPCVFFQPPKDGAVWWYKGSSVSGSHRSGK